MITKEQAEQTFYAQYPQRNREIRNVELRAITTEEMRLGEGDGGYDAQGAFDLEDQVWECTCEYRDKELNLGEWTGGWDAWRTDTCYIVEAKPGPYLID